MRQRIKRAIARLITAIHHHQQSKQAPKEREPETWDLDYILEHDPLDILDEPNPTPEQIETFFDNLDFEMLEWQGCSRISTKMS